MTSPKRGDVWLLDFDPTIGHEQAGRRPALVLSVDTFNQAPPKLVIAVPLTTTQRNHPWHVRVDPPEGGLRAVSFAMCEQVRSLSQERFVARWGTVSPSVVAQVARIVRAMIGE
jgi:mRNA interferase MazF